MDIPEGPQGLAFHQEAPVLVTFGRQLLNAFFICYRNPEVESYRLVY